MRKCSSLHDMHNLSSLQLKLTKYISFAAKILCMKCFDAEKLHSKVQASIFRLFVLKKRYLDRLYTLWEFLNSLNYILCFSICISLHRNPKYTIRKVIVCQYTFRSSKAYHNRY